MKTIHQFARPIRMIAARHGDMIYNMHCQWVGRALEYYGEYCEQEVRLFEQLLAPGDVVWEIGANTGSQAVPLARRVSRGHYVGFEPQPELFKILAANLCVNGLANARCLNIALGETSGSVELPPLNYDQPANFGAVSLIGAGGGGVSVELRTMDEMSFLPQPGFIKLDVEGMEAMVLRGGRSTIKKSRPILYVENDRKEKSKELIELIWSFDYDLYWHISPYFNVENFFDNPENLYGRAVSINMIGFPKEKAYTINGGARILDATAHPI